ncbi:MAG: hypothetical protein AAFP92_05320 [Bacteroidota bacterium]
MTIEEFRYFSILVKEVWYKSHKNNSLFLKPALLGTSERYGRGILDKIVTDITSNTSDKYSKRELISARTIRTYSDAIIFKNLEICPSSEKKELLARFVLGAERLEGKSLENWKVKKEYQSEIYWKLFKQIHEDLIHEAPTEVQTFESNKTSSSRAVPKAKIMLWLQLLLVGFLSCITTITYLEFKPKNSMAIVRDLTESFQHAEASANANNSPQNYRRFRKALVKFEDLWSQPSMEYHYNFNEEQLFLALNSIYRYYQSMEAGSPGKVYSLYWVEESQAFFSTRPNLKHYWISSISNKATLLYDKLLLTKDKKSLMRSQVRPLIDLLGQPISDSLEVDKIIKSRKYRLASKFQILSTHLENGSVWEKNPIQQAFNNILMAYQLDSLNNKNRIILCELLKDYIITFPEQYSSSGQVQKASDYLGIQISNNAVYDYTATVSLFLELILTEWQSTSYRLLNTKSREHINRLNNLLTDKFISQEEEKIMRSSRHNLNLAKCHILRYEISQQILQESMQDMEKATNFFMGFAAIQSGYRSDNHSLVLDTFAAGSFWRGKFIAMFKNQ